MWILLVISLAQQGLLGSNQEQGFGQGQCAVGKANTGSNLAVRHNHNTRCTAGIGINEYRIGDDVFITRHIDYYIGFRNGTCISNAPEDLTCENLHQFRRDPIPFLVLMETSWVKYTGGPIPESPSLRHQMNYQNVSQMDEMSRYVAATLDFGDHQNYPKFPLSKQVGNDTYFFYLNIFVESTPTIKFSPYRRYDSKNGVQYKIDNEDAVMAQISSADGSPYTRKGLTGEENAYGLYTPHSYVSKTNNSSILSGIVLAHPLEIILSDNLENVANADVLNCGGFDYDGDGRALLSPKLEEHRFWVMTTKACVNENSSGISFEIISSLLATAALFCVLLSWKQYTNLPEPSVERAVAYSVLAIVAIVVISTASVFKEFGEEHTIFSSCSTPDDYEYVACNSAYTYRCSIVQILAVVAMVLVALIAIFEFHAMQSQALLLAALTALVIIVVHFVLLLTALPSKQADCGRYHTAKTQWGFWALIGIIFAYIVVYFSAYVTQILRNRFVKIGVRVRAPNTWNPLF